MTPKIETELAEEIDPVATLDPTGETDELLLDAAAAAAIEQPGDEDDDEAAASSAEDDDEDDDSEDDEGDESEETTASSDDDDDDSIRDRTVTAYRETMTTRFDDEKEAETVENAA